jgi:hypothetical protein
MKTSCRSESSNISPVALEMPKPEIQEEQGAKAQAEERGREEGRLERNGCVVIHCENVTVALRRRKGSNQFNMDLGKTPGRNGNRSGWGRNVVVHL